MEFIGIEKKLQGKFITRYDVTYKTTDDKIKVYEMISRNSDIKSLRDLNGKIGDAVVIIATDEDEERILLSREYRLAPGDYVYNFPAGLIDPGETADEAAARELREETGLTLDEINDHLPTSYRAVGFSNETNITVIGKARGEFCESTSTYEEIEARWYTKEEIKELLKTEKFAARTQAYCYMFCR